MNTRKMMDAMDEILAEYNEANECLVTGIHFPLDTLIRSDGEGSTFVREMNITAE